MFDDVLADMVEGVVIANALQDPAASMIRRTLLDAVTADDAPECPPRPSVPVSPARVAER